MCRSSRSRKSSTRSFTRTFVVSSRSPSRGISATYGRVIGSSVSRWPAIGDDVLALQPSAKPRHAEAFRVVPPVGGLDRRSSLQ